MRGHILDDNRFDLSRFRKPYHLIPTGSVESYAGYAVVNEKVGLGNPLSSAYCKRIFFWKLICQGGITLKLYIFLFRVCKPMIFTVPLKLNNNYL